MRKFVEHQADLAVEIQAPDREGLFKDALQAVIELLTGAPVAVDSSESRLSISAEGFDDEEKLVSLLNELLFACQTDGYRPYSALEVEFPTATSVKALIAVAERGSGLPLAREIKAATYHDLWIESGAEWSVKVTFDV